MAARTAWIGRGLQELTRVAMLAAFETWWFLRWIYASARGLPDRRLSTAYVERLTIKYALTAGAFWAAFGLALWNWRAGMIAAGIVTLSYIVPPAKPVVEPGECSPVAR